jgi:phytoene synthase
MIESTLRAKEGAAPSASEPAGGDCGCDDLEQKAGMIRQRIRQMYAGGLDLPKLVRRDAEQHVLHAVELTVSRYQIPPELFLDLVDGLVAAGRALRYATWESLRRNLHAVCGSAGLALACVIGLRGDVRENVLSMAEGIGLAEILFQIRDDVRRGRIVLPLEDLARCSCPERLIEAGAMNDRVRELVRWEAARARACLLTGAEALPWLGDDGSRLAMGLVMAQTMARLDELGRRGYDVFAPAVRVPRWRTLRAVSAAWRLSRRGDGEPIPSYFRSGWLAQQG